MRNFSSPARSPQAILSALPTRPLATLGLLLAALILLLGPLAAAAQAVTTLAGSGSQGFANGAGTAASFYGPQGVAVDGSGTVYVADRSNNCIRKITAAGVVTTLAGSGARGAANGPGTVASFNAPTGVAVDGSGTVYVADYGNHLIRKITAAGVVTTLAGNGTTGSVNGTGTAASFFFPAGVAVDGSGTVYVADQLNNRIRKITAAGVVTTLAGSGAAAPTNGTGTAASFYYPQGVAVDGSGTVYVADYANYLIRQITAAGVTTTLAGTGTAGSANGMGTAASFNLPTGVAVDGSGTVYVADYANNLIRQITPAGVVTTLAGSGARGSANGTGTAASFYSPTGVVVNGSGTMYVADYGNNLIRQIRLLAAPTLSSLSPPAGPVGTSVTLTGTNFSGVTAVSFNGTAASTFTVSSATSATATVPAGATTGNVTITTGGGTSNGVAFTVQTAPAVTTQPANNSYVRTSRPEYRGTAVAGSNILIYRATGSGSFGLTDTTFANSRGNFHKVSTAALADASYAVYVTATASGQAASPNSNTTSFTVDTQAPTVTLSSPTVASGGTTSASPVSFTATFSEPVTGFTSAGLQVTGGAVTSGPSAGSGNAFSFQVTPSGTGSVAVQVLAGPAQDLAGNNNLASGAYAFAFQVPTITVSPASLPPGTQGTAYGSVTFGAGGGSGSYTYVVTSGALPPGLTLTAGGTLSGTPTASGSFSFTVTATDNSAAPGPYSGSRTYTLAIGAPTSTVWTGNVDTDWFTAGNWTNGVPTPDLDAIIPGGLTTYPLLADRTASTRALTIRFAGLLRQTGGILDVRGDLTDDGRYGPSGGTVSLGQTTRASILGNSSIRFWNLDVQANGVVLNTLVGAQVRRVLTLNGNFTTNGNPFTLESNATGTALVVNNDYAGTTASYGVTGNVTVQRYVDPGLNANLGYRHVATAVSGQTVSSLTTSGFTPVVNPAYNASVQPGTVAPFPTVYGYDQGRLATTSNNLSVFDKGWYSPGGPTDGLSVGQGYTVLIQGGQTWSFTGPLNNGSLALSLGRNGGATAADAGLALVGNPYPSPLDWSQVPASDRPGVDPVLYVWRSNDPANPYSGAYGTWDNGIGTGSLGSPVVAQGQGFFVRVTAGQPSGTLTLRNRHRVTTYASPTYLRTAETRPLVRLALQKANGTDVDDAVVYFEAGATAGFDSRYDAEKLANPSGLNLSSSLSATQRLAIKGYAPLGSTQLGVPLAVGVPAAGSYTLKAAELLNLGATPTYLRDLQTGAVVDLARQPSYQFMVSNASALITNRFELLFSPAKPLATAPAALVQQVGLYPNPARTTAFLALPANLGRQAVTATLVDAVGRVVHTVALPAQGTQTHQLDLHELPAGVYALRLTTSAGTIVKRLTVE